MKSVIVAVDMPDSEQQWLTFLSISGTIPANEHTQNLAENVWQIDFAKSPTTFARLIDAMRRFGIPGRILPLDGESQWLPVDSNPMPS
jgi:hypothetical protein